MDRTMILQPWFRKPGGYSIDGASMVSGGDLIDQRHHVIAHVNFEERRIEWFGDRSTHLATRVEKEKAKYDAWAYKQLEKLRSSLVPLDPNDANCSWWSSDMYQHSGVINSIHASPALMGLADKRILDIGGSLLDSWRFLFQGHAASLDHIEVSAITQHLAYWKAMRLFANIPEMVERLTFHTAAAEMLPFADNSFDFVFSRATIHHTKRPDVFVEIERVLKPGGLFWMIEPISGPFIYQLMKASRFVRRADRGTDDPLRQFEIDNLAAMMAIDRDDRCTYLAPFFKFLSQQLLGDAQKWNRVPKSIDRRILAAIGQKHGRMISLVAHKH